MTRSVLKFSDGNFYSITVTKKNCYGGKKIVKSTKVIVISTGNVVSDIGAKRDCQSQIFDTVTK